MRRGAIINSIDLTGCIGKVLKNLKDKSGIKIKFIYTNISGQDIITKHSRAIIPLTERGNKVIMPSDVEKANEQARILGSNLEEEIIHALPFSYVTDSKNDILNPLGLYSHRLEAVLYLVCARQSCVQSLVRAINQAGYEIKDLFFSGLATSKVTLSKEFKEGINLLCDIGGDFTELLVFKDGILRNIQILGVGGDDLTQELASTLKIPFELAEDIKRSYGAVDEYNRITDDKEILIKRSGMYKPIKQKMVCQIATAKTKSLSKTLRDSIEKAVPLNEVKHFIATGRTLLLEGFLETLENDLGIPVRLGRLTHPDIIPFVQKDNNLSGQQYLTYLTSVGLIFQALCEEQLQFSSSPQLIRNPIRRTISKIREVYQEYF